MKIEIIADEDDNFKLFGESEVDVQTVEFIPEPVKPVVAPTENAAPIENNRQSNTFDIFGGTSWAGKMQRPTDIGR